MNRTWATSLTWLVCTSVLAPCISAQVKHVDLSKWGYRPPENVSGEYFRELPAQLVSIGAEGEIAVSFVTRDRSGLATRSLPPLSLHILRLAQDAQLVSQELIPTPSWQDNGVWLGSNGNLLARAGDRLLLLSANMEHLGQREGLVLNRNGVRVFWQVLPLRDRTAVLVSGDLWPEKPVSLLSWDDLHRIKECMEDPYARIESVLDSSLLAMSGMAKGLNRTIQIKEICGGLLGSYSWYGDPLGATLIDKNAVLLAGNGYSVRLIVDGKIRWTDAFDRKHDTVDGHVEVDRRGSVLAIAVKTFSAGNRLLDISSHLKNIRIVVYEAATGRRLMEIPVTPTPSVMFDFALSPQGNALATVSDGVLTTTPIVR